MVESVVQREEEDRTGSTFLRLPKHIRQMGTGGNCPEIYIEDYAEGYLRRLAASDPTEGHVAVLVGELCKSDGKRYVFIRGALETEGVVCEDEVHFSSDIWANVYERIKRFFPQYEAVGWFFGGPEFLTEVNEKLTQIHLDWFGGRDRVLYRVDPVEKTAAFYLYENGEMTKWPGYAIYFDKNEEMQDYLVARKPSSVDAGFREPVMEEIRKRVGGEKDNRGEEEIAGTESEPENPETETASESRQEKNHKSLEKENEKALKEAKAESPQTELSAKGGVIDQTKGMPERKGSPNFALIAAAVVLIAGALVYRNWDALGLSKTPSVTETPTPGVEAISDSAKDALSQAEPEATKIPLDISIVPAYDKGNTSSDALNFDDFVPTEETEFFPELTPVPTPVKNEEIPGNNTEAVFEPEKVTEKITPTAEPETQESFEPMELYIVKEGDTLAGICRRYYGDAARLLEVKDLNQIVNENFIIVGQEIYLPQ